MKARKLKRKRGRPRLDYSGLVGFEGPMGLRIVRIREEGNRAREGPRVDAVCKQCGEPSHPRLRDVLNGHSKTGGCLKKECFLAYCDRVVARLDESVVAGVWASRFSGMARKATAASFKLAYPIMDAAMRTYQKKLDVMITDGTAEKIYQQASLARWDIGTTASQFGLTCEAVRYLNSAFRRRLKLVQTAPVHGAHTGDEAAQTSETRISSDRTEMQDHIWGCACHAASVVSAVDNRRKDWSIARPGELSFDELKRKKGKLVGKLAWLYEQCALLLEDANLPAEHREDIQEFVDLATSTLSNRRGRQKWRLGKSVRAEKQHQTESRQQEALEQIGFGENE